MPYYSHVYLTISLRHRYRQAIHAGTRFILALCVLAAGSALAQSGKPATGADDSAVAALSAHLAGLQSMAVTFKQQMFGAKGAQVDETSHGELRLRRPNFRWEIREPYRQTLVSDGKTMRLYDPDLESVTVRDVDPADALPINLLNQDTANLVSKFAVDRVSSPDTEANADRFRLRPKDSQSLYEELLLEFSGDRLTLLVIRDQAGQQTVISFETYSDPGEISDSDFELEVPDGTDVIRG